METKMENETAAKKDQGAADMLALAAGVAREGIDFSVLERISEADVMMWMAARLARLREGELPVRLLRLSAGVYSGAGVCVLWDIHAAGECELGRGSSACAAEALMEHLSGKAKRIVIERRWKAERALREADEVARLMVAGRGKGEVAS